MRQLSQTALRLFLDRGVNEASIDDITQAAGVAKGSFYRYFEDKDALLAALLEPVSREALGALERCGGEVEAATTTEEMFASYRTLAESLAGTMMTHVDVVRLYLQESRGPAVGPRAQLVALSRSITRAAEEVTSRAHRHGLLRPIPPIVSTLAVVGAAERILLALFNEEEVGNPLTIPDHLITLILHGLRLPEAAG